MRKKKFVFKNKTKTNVANINFFCGTCEFCFTNMKTILQKCVPNKILNCYFENFKIYFVTFEISRLYLLLFSTSRFNLLLWKL